MVDVWNWFVNFVSGPLITEILATLVGSFLIWTVNRIRKSILKQAETKAYLKNIESANQEVIVKLIPGINEGYYPSREIIASLLEAESLRHLVKKSEVYSIGQVINELIREVMDSGFLSQEQKNLHTNKLLEISHSSETLSVTDAVTEDSLSKYAEMNRDYNLEKDKTAEYISVAVGGVALLLTFIYFKNVGLVDSKVLIYMAQLIITVLVFSITLLVVQYRVKARSKSASSHIKTSDNTKKGDQEEEQ